MDKVQLNWRRYIVHIYYFKLFQIWMDEDLEMLSDPCNGVTCYKDLYASKLILQGMTNKLKSWNLSVPMKDKLARIKSDATQGAQCLEQKMHGFVLGICTRGKMCYYNKFFYTLISLITCLIAGDCSLTINRLKKWEVGMFKDETNFNIR